jgi:hypothetical protein
MLIRHKPVQSFLARLEDRQIPLRKSFQVFVENRDILAGGNIRQLRQTGTAVFDSSITSASEPKTQIVCLSQAQSIPTKKRYDSVKMPSLLGQP